MQPLLSQPQQAGCRQGPAFRPCSQASSSTAAAPAGGRRSTAQQNRGRRQPVALHAVVKPEISALRPEATVATQQADLSRVQRNQIVREGHYEASLVALQASKADSEQPSIASVLPRFDPATETAELLVVGAGPAGLALAAAVAAQGVKVAVVGHDAPFVNNYGVWCDEFEALGLGHCLDHTWSDACCWFGEGREVRVGRAYGRVCRRALRQHLLESCAAAGVRFMAGEVVDVAVSDDGEIAEAACVSGETVRARLVTLASGAAAGRLLRYEASAPGVAAQTAYGIEAQVEGYGQAYDASSMLFMDFRRHHSGVWQGAAPRLVAGEHPAGGDNLWGTDSEVPSFLYAMPLGDGRVFLEETCLVAKPALPFAVLKRRLHRRLEAMGVSVGEVHEEEWSYIPVGGPLPLRSQAVTAFGAAANLVHPATGYSIARSLREAPGLAEEIAAALRRDAPVLETSGAVWDALWSREKRRQAAFHVFGMELLCQLDLAATNAFFLTFFRLPPYYWRGFLASSLGSGQLLAFALLTFAAAPISIKAKLVGHLTTHPAGSYLLSKYLGRDTDEGGAVDQAVLAAALLLALPAAAVMPHSS